MAIIKISEIPTSISSLSGNEQVPTNIAGHTKTITTQQIADLACNNTMVPACRTDISNRIGGRPSNSLNIRAYTVMTVTPTVTVGSHPSVSAIASSRLIPWTPAVWVTGTAYQGGDYVSYNSIIYKSTQDHTSTSFEADISTKWIVTSELNGPFRFEAGQYQQAGNSYPDTLCCLNKAPFTGLSTQGLGIKVGWETDEPDFEIFYKSENHLSELFIDGQAAKIVAWSSATDGETFGDVYRRRVRLPTRKRRRFLLIGSYSFYFGGIQIPIGGRLWYPTWQLGPRIAFFGDSLTEGLGASHTLDSAGMNIFWRRQCELLTTGVGGSGFLAAPSGRVTYRQRLVNDLGWFLNDSNYKGPSACIVWGSRNDYAPPYGIYTPAQITAEVTLFINAFKTNFPNTVLILLGFYNNTVTPAFAADDAVRTAAELANVPFVSTANIFNSDNITGSIAGDGLHPSKNGYRTHALGWADQVCSILDSYVF